MEWTCGLFVHEYVNPSATSSQMQLLNDHPLNFHRPWTEDQIVHSRYPVFRHRSLDASLYTSLIERPSNGWRWKLRTQKHARRRPRMIWAAPGFRRKWGQRTRGWAVKDYHNAFYGGKKDLMSICPHVLSHVRSLPSVGCHQSDVIQLNGFHSKMFRLKSVTPFALP